MLYSIAPTYLRHVRLYCCFLLAVVTLCSCGGGTSGTDGGPEVRIVGTLTSSDGTALSNARVTIEESGESAVSDSAGGFELIERSASDRLTLLVESQGKEARTLIQNLPTKDSTLEIQLSFDPLQGSVSVVSVEVLPLDAAAEPSPTSTPESTTSTTKSPASTTEDPADTPKESGHKAPKPDPEPETANPEPKASKTPAKPTPAATPHNASILEGKIIGPEGAPFDSVTIIIDRVGKTTSNSSGRFQIRFPVGQTQLVVKLRYRGFGASVTLSNLPEHATQVSLILQIQRLPGPSTSSDPEKSVDREIVVSIESLTFEPAP